MIVSPEPFKCPELTSGVLREYEADFRENRSPQWRAWTREADRACRANAALLQKD